MEKDKGKLHNTGEVNSKLEGIAAHLSEEFRMLLAVTS